MSDTNCVRCNGPLGWPFTCIIPEGNVCLDCVTVREVEMKMEGTRPTPSLFDPDFSPDHIVNQRAARSRGLRYDEKRKQYVDRDGLPVRDRFGQPL